MNLDFLQVMCILSSEQPWNTLLNLNQSFIPPIDGRMVIYTFYACLCIDRSEKVARNGNLLTRSLFLKSSQSLQFSGKAFHCSSPFQFRLICWESSMFPCGE